MQLQLRSTILQNFSECQKKIYWSIIKELVTKDRPDYFDLGSLTHEGIKAFIHPKFKALTKDERIYNSLKHLENYANQEKINQDLVNEALKYIQLYHCQEPDKDINILSVEQPFSIILKDEKNLHVTYGATLDALGRDKHRNSLVYLEHKTTSGYGSVYSASIQNSPQISGAVYCAQKNLKEEIELVYINYIVKTKKPRLERDRILINQNRLKVWYKCVLDEMEKFLQCLNTGIWSMNQHACWQFRKNKCPYTTLCWFGENERTLSQFEKRKIGKPTDKVLLGD